MPPVPLRVGHVAQRGRGGSIEHVSHARGTGHGSRPTGHWPPDGGHAEDAARYAARNTGEAP